MSVVIRVDPDVYAAIMAEKHLVERERRCSVSMNEALRSALGLNDPDEGGVTKVVRDADLERKLGALIVDDELSQ